MPESWWEPRREGEATADYLARVLDELGAGELATQARACHFDDYRCPPDVDDGMNIHRLVHGVKVWALHHPAAAPSATPPVSDRAALIARVRAVVNAAFAGEFDGTTEESRAWAETPEGRATFRELMGGP